ncbi:MAG: hypothetical protein IJ622_06935 [Bacteroidales bacterium]|nr:hypothetical protein [Bacteroidales bacterium]
MKKLALALACLVSVAFFASCTDPVENPQPSIQVLQQDGYLQNGDVVDVNYDELTMPFGFVMASNNETNKALSHLKVDVESFDLEDASLGVTNWADKDIEGTSYTYEDAITFQLQRDLVGRTVITAIVTDAAGETATATIQVSLNEAAQPLTVRTFTWNRHGGEDGTGLDEFGLKWTRNLSKAIYAIIEPVDGAILYRFDPTDWDATTTDVEKAALFSEATPADPQQWKEFNVAGAMTQEFDVVLGTAYNGEYHLMHITKGTYYSFKGTDATITGEAK